MKETPIFIDGPKKLEWLRDRGALDDFNFSIGDILYSWWCDNPDCQKSGAVVHAERQRQFIEKQLVEKPETVLPMYGIGEKYFNCTLDSFRDYPELVEKFRRYLHEPLYSIFITGSCGTGKTHIAVALIRELIRQGRSNIFFKPVTEFMLELRNTFDDGSPYTETDLINRLSMYNYLVLDDLGSEKFSEYSISSLYMVIDRRLTYSKPTIITSNLSLEQINDTVSSRIASRLTEYRVFNFNGDDYRAKR